MKNQNGITLIALVTTIIILLILAGISIKTLFDDEGIIGRSQNLVQEIQEDQNTSSGTLYNVINELNDSLDD